MKPATKTGWSPERRARHSQAIKRWKPWEKSTGPKTAQGKSVSCLNAYKSGEYDRSTKRHAYILNLQSQYRRLYRDLKKDDLLYLFPRFWRSRLIHEMPNIQKHGLDNPAHIRNEIDSLFYGLFAAVILPQQKKSSNELLDRLVQSRHCERQRSNPACPFWIASSARPPRNDESPKIMQKTGFFRAFALHHPP